MDEGFSPVPACQRGCQALRRVASQAPCDPGHHDFLFPCGQRYCGKGIVDNRTDKGIVGNYRNKDVCGKSYSEVNSLALKSIGCNQSECEDGEDGAIFALTT